MSDQTVDSGPAKTRFSAALATKPNLATGALVLGNGAILWGLGLGAEGRSLGEVCFNTSMSGYQEILMDPSYAGQIITFTFPHIGNVGANDFTVLYMYCTAVLFWNGVEFAPLILGRNSSIARQRKRSRW